MRKLFTLFLVFSFLQPDVSFGNSTLISALAAPLVSARLPFAAKARIESMVSIGRFLLNGDPEIKNLSYAPPALFWIDGSRLSIAALGLAGTLISLPLIDNALRGPQGTSVEKMAVSSVLLLSSVVLLPLTIWLKGYLERTGIDFAFHFFMDMTKLFLHTGDIETISTRLTTITHAIKPVIERNTEIRLQLREIIFLLVLAGPILCYLDPLIAAAVFILTVKLGSWLNKKSARLKPLSEMVRLADARLAPVLYEIFSSIQLRHIRANHLEVPTLSEVKRHVADIHSHKKRLETAQRKQGILQILFTGSLLMACITLLCVWKMYLFHNLTVGTMLVILSISGHIQFKFTTLGNALRDFQNSEGAAHDLFAFMAHRPLATPQFAIKNADIECSHVYFTVGNTAILRDVTFTLKAGETLLLQGENGSGKTTLLRLLAGLHTPTAGEIHIGGHRPQEIISSVVLIDQEYSLRNSLNLKENLQLVVPDATEAMLRAALTEAGVRFVRGFADGLDSRVNTLSGGERQRIALACALLKKNEILLLDEPASALDTESRLQLEATLQRLHEEGHTIIVISHIDLNIRAHRLILNEGGLQRTELAVAA